MRALLLGAVQRRVSADGLITCEDGGGGGAPSAADRHEAFRAWLDTQPHTAACGCRECRGDDEGRAAEKRGASRRRQRRARVAEGGGAAPGGVGEARSAERGVSRAIGEGAEPPGAGGAGGGASRSRDRGRNVAEEGGDRRVRLRNLQEQLRDHAVSETVRLCGLVPIKGAQAVEVWAGDGCARFGGTQHCGSPWACPVCADRLRAERAELLGRVGNMCRERGHGLSLVTLTIAHAKGCSLRQMRRGVARAWRRVRGHRRWRAWCKRHYVGDVRALEVTYSGYAGWHPHLHMLLVTRESLRSAPGWTRISWEEMGAIGGGVAAVTGEARELRDLLADLWSDAVVRELGEEHAPNRYRGVDVRESKDSAYLAKMGLEGLAAELSDAGLAKRGRRGGHLTPWQIAERAAAGNEGYQALWREYQAEMSGAHQLEYSAALRPLLAQAELDRQCEKAEAENRADDAGAEPESPITRIPLPVWGDIRSARMDDGRLVRIAVLDAVDAGGGADGVWATICQYYDERAARWPHLKTAEAMAYETRRGLSAHPLDPFA